MAGFRISAPAGRDLEQILATSLERWGEAGRARYAALLAGALRSIARDPTGSATRERTELSPGVRSMHLRYARGARRVKDPVHVIFYRRDADVVEVVRVLHERMEPTLHFGTRKTRRR
jgi:toxin ParE1/3/4